MSEAHAIQLFEAGAMTLQAPEQVIANATRAATKLMEIINAKPQEDKVIINKQLYLELEDWTMLGRFFNSTPKIRSDQYVQYGDVEGFEATADLVTIIDGQPMVIATAMAMCLSDEEKWGDRPKYEWRDVLDSKGAKIWEGPEGNKKPRRERVQVGSEPTPLFQLRSMAQTRAAAKVLRLGFSWVVVLANNKAAQQGTKISTTPAEEMDGNTIEGHMDNGKPEVAKPQKSEARTGRKISEGQRKRMFAMAREAGFDADTRVKQVTEAYGYASPGDVVMGKNEGEYDFICQCLVNKEWKAPAAAKPKPIQLIPVTVEGKCKGLDEVPADGDKDAFIVAHFDGKEVHCFDHRTFDKVRKMPDKVCKLGCGMKEGYPDKVKLLAILKIGDEEWLEDGTPVIQQGKQ
jgi:hypothetical protein